MTDQGTLIFAAAPGSDITVDREPDKYGFYFARSAKIDLYGPIVGCGSRTPEESERLLRRMLREMP